MQWADEIIVVDSGSDDQTLAIAADFQAKIFSRTDWQGFGVQKNRALEQANCEWVLSIDADEVVPEKLQQDIQQAIQQTDCSAYELPRISQYCGRWIKHGDWRNDRVVRLFKRNAARFSDDRVHEQLLVEGSVGQLKTPLHHYPFDSLEAVLNKVNSYSSAGAAMRLARGKRGSLRQAILHGLWTFLNFSRRIFRWA